MFYEFIHYNYDVIHFFDLFEAFDALPEVAEALPADLLPRTLPPDEDLPAFFCSCHARYFLNWAMVIWSVVLVDFLPDGDGAVGRVFLAPVVVLLAETLPAAGADWLFCGVSFLLPGLLGVYLTILSTLFLTSAEAPASAFLAVPFLALAADLEAAFALPLAPPLT